MMLWKLVTRKVWKSRIKAPGSVSKLAYPPSGATYLPRGQA